MADEAQVLGITADAAQVAKVAAAGGFGSGVMVYLRHPGTMARAALLWIIGVGMATIFASPASGWSGFGEIQCAAVIGLLGKAVASGVLGAVEKIDFSQWIPGKK